MSDSGLLGRSGSEPDDGISVSELPSELPEERGGGERVEPVSQRSKSSNLLPSSDPIMPLDGGGDEPIAGGGDEEEPAFLCCRLDPWELLD